MTVANIVPDPDQPRKHFDPEEIRQLGASMRKDGQYMPLVVFWRPDFGKWEIDDGERRWIAAQAAGIDRLWCMFRQKKMTTTERRLMQLKVNCLRADLRDIERAKAFRQLMDDNGWTQQQLAAELNLSQGNVARALAPLKLPESMQADVIAGKVSGSGAMRKKKGSAARKAGKIINGKGKDWKGTLVFKKAPTREEVRAALVAWIDSLPGENRDAA